MQDKMPSFPPFSGVLAAPVYDCGTAQLQLFADVQKLQYERYVRQLLAAGFTLFDAYSFGENFHSTLLSGKTMLHLYFCEAEKALRVVFDSDTALYQSKAQAVQTRCETVLYQFETDHTLIDCGMCYILQCADGSFFLIDSAHYFSVNDNDRIHKFLRERTPPGEKIVIAGWYFSHAHNDHICKFMDFLRYNCDDVRIEGLYFNFVPLTHPDSIHWSARDHQIQSEFLALVASKTEIPKIRIHTGQHFFIRNLEFTVLYTHEDVYPHSCEGYNTSSSVLLLRVGGTQVLFPGDASGIASEILLRRYGSLLQSDILQVAHHGHFGLSPAFYETVQAEIALFPTTQIKYDEEFLVYEANRRAAALCKYCYISANGTVAIPLPYAGGGATFLQDETFEDFHYIQRLWGYTYTPERKQELLDAFIRRNTERSNGV